MARSISTQSFRYVMNGLKALFDFVDTLIFMFDIIPHVGPYRRNFPDGVKWDPMASKPIQRDWDQVTRVIPLDKTYEELQTYLKASVNTTHGHEHTFTCKKGGRRGDHFDCRMDYDLPLVPSTCLIADATFAVRRDHGMLPAFVPGLQLAYPANHVMQLTCDVTRWLRQHLLYQDAQKENNKQVSCIDFELCIIYSISI